MGGKAFPDDSRETQDSGIITLQDMDYEGGLSQGMPEGQDAGDSDFIVLSLFSHFQSGGTSS